MRRVLLHLVVTAALTSAGCEWLVTTKEVNDGGTSQSEDGGASNCTPTATCESLGASCGTPRDECGNQLSCGECATGTCRTDFTCPTIETCDTQGWCELKPIPGDGAVTAIWGLSEADLWIGTTGPLLHWDGAQLSVRRDGPTNVAALSGLAANKIWAAADQSVWFYDGNTWSEMRKFGWWPLAMIAIPDGGSFGLAVVGHWNDPSPNWNWSVGAATFRDGFWKDETSAAPVPGASVGPYLGAVWGASMNEVWAVGLEGLWKFDGSSWSHVDASSKARIGIAGASANNVWGTGYIGAVVHYDGSNWSTQQLSMNGQPYGYPLAAGVFAFSANDVWIPTIDGLFHSTDGSSFNTVVPVPTNSDPQTMWGGPAVMYLGGYNRWGGAGMLHRKRR